MFSFMKELKEVRRSSTLSKQEQADKIALIALPKWMSAISQHSGTIVVASMWGVSSAICFKYLSFANHWEGWTQYFGFAATPFIFILSFVLLGSFFAQLSKAGIVEGKFPRKANHPIYALRKIFGAAWTQVYYFKPLYAVCLAISPLKNLLFRGFGYRGAKTFTVYPDSWIRDLPVLNIGKDAYLANRCVIGTNMCLSDGSILVGKCTLNEGSMVGHLGMFALGGTLGKNSEIGVSAGTGIRVRIGENVTISPNSTVYHACDLGNNVKIGGCAIVGMKSKIANGVEIKAGSIIPPGTELHNQAEADQYFKREVTQLEEQKEALFAILRDHIPKGHSA